LKLTDVGRVVVVVVRVGCALDGLVPTGLGQKTHRHQQHCREHCNLHYEETTQNTTSSTSHLLFITAKSSSTTSVIVVVVWE